MPVLVDNRGSRPSKRVSLHSVYIRQAVLSEGSSQDDGVTPTKIDDRGIAAGESVSHCISLCGYNPGGITCTFTTASPPGFGFAF